MTLLSNCAFFFFLRSFAQRIKHGARKWALPTLLACLIPTIVQMSIAPIGINRKCRVRVLGGPKGSTCPLHSLPYARCFYGCMGAWDTYLDRCRVQRQRSSRSCSANKSMIGVQQQVDVVQGIACPVQFVTFGRRPQVDLWRVNILSRLIVRYLLAELEVQPWSRYPVVSKEFYCLAMEIGGGKWGSCACWNCWLLERTGWKDHMNQFDCCLSKKYRLSIIVIVV